MLHVVFEFVPEVVQEALHRPRRGFTERDDVLLIQLQVVPNHLLWVYLPTGLGGIILSYLLFASRLVPRPIALLGLENWRFLKPVLFGDTVHVRMTMILLIGAARLVWKQSM